MKSLVISNSLWNIYNFRYSLLIELSKISKVVIYCNFKNNQSYLKKFPKHITIKDIKFSSKSRSFFHNIKLIFSFIKILINEKPDYIFSFTLKPNLYLGIINNFFKISFFPTISGLGTSINRGGILFLFIKILMKFSFKSSSKIFVHNRYENFFLVKLGIKKNRIIQVNGSGINLSKYKKNQFKKNICNNYIFVGRLIADKGINELVKAFKVFNTIENPKSKLTLVLLKDEDNETAINIENLKSQLKNRNIIIKKNVRNIKKILKESGCLILPSYSEGMSRSIMEAISSSRPVLCSNIFGCKEMVRNNFNGFLFKPKSEKSIFNALKKFNNLSLSNKIKFAKNSRILAETNRFDEKYVVWDYIRQINNNETS